MHNFWCACRMTASNIAFLNKLISYFFGQVWNLNKSMLYKAIIQRWKLQQKFLYRLCQVTRNANVGNFSLAIARNLSLATDCYSLTTNRLLTCNIVNRLMLSSSKTLASHSALIHNLRSVQCTSHHSSEKVSLGVYLMKRHRNYHGAHIGPSFLDNH